MNFERLFKECGITTESKFQEAKKHSFMEGDVYVVTEFKTNTSTQTFRFRRGKGDIILYNQSPEMLKALIEICVLAYDLEPEKGSALHIAITAIESATGKPWTEIKEILEGEG